MLAKKTYLPYEEAKKIVQSYKIKTVEQWREFTKTAEFKIHNLPISPDKVYKEQGWSGFPIFLGTDGHRGRSKRKSFLPFDQATEMARSLNYKTSHEWSKYKKNRPNGLPSAPDRYYASEWISWPDFLGFKALKGFGREFLPFDEAKKLVLQLKEEYNLISGVNWVEFTKNKKFPFDKLPHYPRNVYTNEWIDMYDWLGEDKPDEYVSYDEAASIVRPYNLQSLQEFNIWSKNHRPKGFPSAPQNIYKEFISWPDFLGYSHRRWTKNKIIDFIKSFKDNKLNEIQSPVIMLLFMKHLGAPIGKLIKTKQGEKTLGEIFKDLSEPEEADDKINIEDLDDICDNLENESEDDNYEDNLDDQTDDVDIREDYESDLNISSENIERIEKLIIKNTDLSTSHEIEAIVNICVNALWRKYWLSLDAEEILSMKKGNLADSIILNRFETDYLEANAMQIPDGYSSQKIPANKIKLMQKLICTKLIKSPTKSLGNYSKAGAGKTLSAILASRYVNSKNTLLLAMNSTCEQWANEIVEFFPDTKVFDYNGNIGVKITEFANESSDRNWIILNFEKFQQVNSKALVEFLLELDIDFIVIDEMQNIKVRGNDVTKRRQHIEHLVSEARKVNPDLHLLAMSATPFMNELQEVKSILKLILNDQLEHLQVKNKLFNALAMHTYIVNYGVREIPNYGIQSNFNHFDIIHDDLNDILTIHKTENILHKEEMLINIKLNHISQYLKPGTIIYSHYTDSNKMLQNIAKHIKNEHDLKVAVYSNQSIEEREDIKNKFINKEIDVLIASQTIATGVDGLQKVCDNMIVLSLPWTQAQWEQLVSRIARQGGKFENVNIIIPAVKYISDKGEWSWDTKRLAILDKKKNWGDAVMDGVIPSYTSDEKTFQKDLVKAHKGANKWIEELEKNGVFEVDQNPLASLELNEIQIKQRNRSRFSDLNRTWKTSGSDNLHKKLVADPSEWKEYHNLYSDARKEWPEIPVNEIAEQLKSNLNYRIADLGCGECLLSDLLPKHNIQGYDHVAFDSRVISADISCLKCKNESYDVAVLSLALMGANWADYIIEANRILVNNGLIFIAENAGSWEGDKFCKLKETLELTGFTIFQEKKSFDFIYIKAIKNN
jgi:superfamily II DNA or RNA helicase